MITFLSLTLFACEGIPEGLLYERTGIDDVVDLGEVKPIEIERYWTTYFKDGGIAGGWFGNSGTETSEWWANASALRTDDPTVTPGIIYGQLGAGPTGTYGGASFTFKGTGGKVCVIVDPEALSWNQSVSPEAKETEYWYQDEFGDDGDLDLSAGLSAYYTGAPGEEMGDFQVPYTDANGQDHTIAFDECARTNSNGIDGSSGRAYPDYCDIDTTGREGVLFTVVLDRFSLPINDSVLNYGVAVFEVGEGGCSGGGSNTAHPPVGSREIECAIPSEWTLGDYDASIDCDNEESWSWECLEQAFCKNAKSVNNYCETWEGADGFPCYANDHVVAKDE